MVVFTMLFVFIAVGITWATTAREFADAGKVHLDNGEYTEASVEKKSSTNSNNPNH